MAGNTTHESFLELLDVHAWLDEEMFAHQSALLARDARRAAEHLEAFAGGLARHIEDEERLLLPLYERAGRIEGGAPTLYLAEHRKLLAMVDDMRGRLAALDLADPSSDRRIIGLLDRECRLKNLLLHHDERERNLLYPALDRVATGAERRDALAEAFRPVPSGRESS
jgi:hemerythrin-like domain-containing protein